MMQPQNMINRYQRGRLIEKRGVVVIGDAPDPDTGADIMRKAAQMLRFNLDPMNPGDPQKADIDTTKLGEPNTVIEGFKVWVVPEEKYKVLFPNPSAA
jgi:hypothetical protein